MLRVVVVILFIAIIWSKNMKNSKEMTFLEAALAVLEEMKQPMHFKKITELAIQKKLLHSKGKTPEWTMGARISTDVKEKGIKSEFVRTDNGKYGLRRWRRSGMPTITMPESNHKGPRYWLWAADAANFNHDQKNDCIDLVGVKYRMRKTLSRLAPNDKIVVYLKKDATVAAILDVVAESYIDESDRWPEESKELNARIAVTPFSVLPKDQRFDARQLYTQMAVFTQYPAKHRTLALRNGITEISEQDYNIVANSLA
jgi:hypothetical protein